MAVTDVEGHRRYHREYQRERRLRLGMTKNPRNRRLHRVQRFGHEEEKLPPVPRDTRDLTARLCGDPLPGRSALDMERSR